MGIRSRALVLWISEWSLEHSAQPQILLAALNAVSVAWLAWWTFTDSRRRNQSKAILLVERLHKSPQSSSKLENFSSSFWSRIFFFRAFSSVSIHQRWLVIKSRIWMRWRKPKVALPLARKKFLNLPANFHTSIQIDNVRFKLQLQWLCQHHWRRLYWLDWSGFEVVMETTNSWW